jgi:hypothetical protein
MARIAVWTHTHDEVARRRRAINEISAVWREQGHEVVVCAGPIEPKDADVIIAHIDRTVIPDEYRQIRAGLGRVVNGGVGDISKRRISRNLVGRFSDWAGPVIVKTDANCGGGPEWKAARRGNSLGFRAMKWVRANLPWSWHVRFKSNGYRVFDSKREVPEAVWWNPALVVEKFLPEMNDGLYCLRVWMFFGSRSTHSMIYATEPVVKGTGIVKSEYLGDPPPELVERRRELGFDYGKFDYVISNGEVVLLDVNSTPSLPYEAERYRPRAEILAGGLEDFL